MMRIEQVRLLRLQDIQLKTGKQIELACEEENRRENKRNPSSGLPHIGKKRYNNRLLSESGDSYDMVPHREVQS